MTVWHRHIAAIAALILWVELAPRAHAQDVKRSARMSGQSEVFDSARSVGRHLQTTLLDERRSEAPVVVYIGREQDFVLAESARGLEQAESGSQPKAVGIVKASHNRRIGFEFRDGADSHPSIQLRVDDSSTSLVLRQEASLVEISEAPLRDDPMFPLNWEVGDAARRDMTCDEIVALLAASYGLALPPRTARMGPAEYCKPNVVAWRGTESPATAKDLILALIRAMHRQKLSAGGPVHGYQIQVGGTREDGSASWSLVML